ncbi:MAG: histidinol dehydrogenase [Dehalococcoidia bacterium]|nr:histidinol dehydrogenase [Dehalococcoidia bacterium]
MKVIRDYRRALKILERSIQYDPGGRIETAVREIIAGVRKGGDQTLIAYAERFDGARLKSLEVKPREVTEALTSIDPRLMNALKFAAARLVKFHKTCLRIYGRGFFKNGLGQQVLPIEHVGIYVPGGTASYPSTVLMTAIPARVAGVKEIIMATPCGKDGKVPAGTLAAAFVAGVDRIFKIGGAQAVAAMAFGTVSVPRVDKICGPGNIYVTTAKKMVYGLVDIDALQGPSEVMLIADGTANASFCAADLIAQSEHDVMASSIFVTTSEGLADKVQAELKKQLSGLKRKTIVGRALTSNGLIIIVKTMEQAIDLANLYAPEHLSIMVKNAERYISRIRNAGCICIGQYSPVVLGDYVAGPSHALPTGGSARFSSPLNVLDFFKISSIIALEDSAIRRLGPAAALMADSEGLTGHAGVVRIRLKKGKNK